MTYTLRQTGDLTGLSTKTLRRKIASGELAATKQQGKFGEEYIIEEIPEQLLLKAATTTGQPVVETKTESVQQATDAPQVSGDGHPAEKVDQPDTGQPSPAAPGQDEPAIARDRALFADLFSIQSTGQKVTRPQPQSTGRSDWQGSSGKQQEKGSANTQPSGTIASASNGQTSGQNTRHAMDSDVTLHELLKLIRKLQEENAALHEKIGELNATVQLLSSGRMLPMSIPFPLPPGKSWWQKLSFWKK